MTIEWVRGCLRGRCEAKDVGVAQIRFVNLIIDELTANGVMEPERLFESPFTDHAPTGPRAVYDVTEVDAIVDLLRVVKTHAVPSEVA